MSRKEIVGLLIEANEKNIALFLEGDKLKYTLKNDTVADESFLAQLRSHKEEIKEFLKKQSADIVKPQDNPITPFDRQEVLRIPLSFSQERLWFIDRLEGSSHYHIPTILKLAPGIEEEGVKYAVNELINRHETLRTIYKEDGQGPYQEILPQGSWPCTVSESSEEDLQKHIYNVSKKPFDLSNDCMLRAELIKLPSDHKVLVLVVHHIAFDGWSQPIFIQELKTYYGKWISGDTTGLPPLSVQYADYAMWQRTFMQGDVLENTMLFWEERLKGLSPLSLKTDYPRPPIQSTKGRTVTLPMPDKYRDALRQFSAKEGVTQFMVLFAAFSVLLSRYTGKKDICIGTPVANRSKEELASLIGFFVNTLAIRCNLGEGMSFLQLLAHVKATLLEAYEHQELPFEKIIERLGVSRDISRNPLVQILFVFQEANKGSLSRDQVQESGPIQVISQSSDSSKFDLTMSVVNDEKGLRLSANYCTDLFSEKTMKSLLAHFAQLIISALESPEAPIHRLRMVGETEEHKLMKWSKGPTQELGGAGLLDMFAKQVKKHPDKVAIVSEKESMTYREVDVASDYLAKSLSEAGVKSNDYVVICQSRSLTLIVSILAVTKAGGTYIPLDPNHPSSRIEWVLNDLGANYAVVNDSTTKFFESFDIELFQTDLRPAPCSYSVALRKPDQLAYVIYTSGSTGRPKGVMIREKSLLNLIHWHKERFGNNEHSHSTVVAGVGFDASAWEIWPYLLTGGTLHIIDDNTTLSVIDLVNVFESKQITHCFLPTALVPDFVKYTKERPMSLKHLLTGGDALPALDVSGLAYALHNNYGPTENTVVSTAHLLTQSDEKQAPAIGRPINNTYAIILDQHMNVVPGGVEGDLYLGGEQLASGYLNNEELTEKAFLDNPLVWGGSKIYKTGDRASWDENGDIFFAGRQDDQISIRGFRVELGEVQAILQMAPGVDQCMVMVREDIPGDKRIAAYVVPTDIYTDNETRDYLMERLPRYMMPAAIVEIDRFPLTENGKIDKSKLPVPKISGAEAYAAPVSITEKALVPIWAELLKVEECNIGIDDDFFVMGGHSLLATRLVSQIVHNLSIELTVKDVFLNPNIRDLAAHIDLLEKKETVGIEPAERDGVLPLSFAQERLWFIDKLEGSTQYHISSTFPLGSKADSDGVAHAYRSVINRHEILRTIYKEQDGVPFQYVLPEQDWKLDKVNLPGEELSTYMEGFKKRPFDLSMEIPIRGELLETDKGFLLLVVTHHIASDGWSHPIFENEMQEFYQSWVQKKEPELSNLTIQYADYAVWQQSYFKGQLLSAKLQYWEEKLKGLQTLAFPTDLPRPAAISTAGRSILRSLPKERLSEIKSLSEKNGATLFMTMLSAFQLLLSRYSGQDDIVVGTPVANRGHKEIEPLIGFFVNTLVLRNKIDDEVTFVELLQHIKSTTLSAYEHQDVPFEKIVERVEKSRDMSRNPVFQVMFLHQINKQNSVTPDHEVSFVTESKFDITLSIVESPDQGLKVGVTYCTDLFLKETMEQFLGQYITLLEQIVADPEAKLSSLSLMNSEEQESLQSIHYNAQPLPEIHETVMEKFDRQALLTPDHVALYERDEEITYKDLQVRSNALSHQLHARGVRPGDIVGVSMERSSDLIITIFGILKAGCAYLPIDWTQPDSRRAYILDHTGAQYLVADKTTGSFYDGFEAVTVLDYQHLMSESSTSEDEKPAHESGIEDLAYIIYTSGSTGTPKGVMVEHRSLANLIETMQDQYPLEAGDSYLLKTNVVFDVSCSELFGWFVSGGSLAILPQGDESDPIVIKDALVRYRVSHVNFVPSMLGLFLEEVGRKGSTGLESLRYIISAGEPLARNTVDYFNRLGLSTRLENLYGPTEATIYATGYSTSSYEGLRSVPIGKPLRGVKAYVLDTANQLAGLGVPGELCLGGIALARGYYNNPELTSEKFVDNPYDGESESRLYKTGDLVRWLPDGNLEYLGRIDEQVKLRGYRIELGEITHWLKEFEGVAEGIVQLRGEGENQYLVGYYVSEEELLTSDIREYLQAHLPSYMVPDYYVRIEELPLLPSGKIDKKKLPEPQRISENTFQAAENDVQEVLAKIWSELLKIDEQSISINANFFEHGGHSLLAIRLISRIKTQLKVTIAVKDIFLKPTIKEQECHINSLEKVEREVVAVQAKRPEKIPLSFSQERLWFIDKLEGSTQYHIPIVMKLEEGTSAEGIAYAYSELVNRHEVLRTVFREYQGEPYQQILKPQTWGVSYGEANEEVLNEAIHEEVRKPFDLARDPMLRAKLISLDTGGHVLILVVHHISFDGWSQPIFMRELVQFYQSWKENKAPDLKPLPMQYADYAIKQRESLKGAVLESKLGFWEQALKGVSPLNLPTDFTRPAMQSTKGGFVSKRLSITLSDQISNIGKQHNATLFMTLLAAFKVFLYRYTRQGDICIGSPVANRQDEEIEPLIGFFVNTLAFRTGVNGQVGFLDLLTKVRDTTLLAYDHQDIPFEKIVERVEKHRDTSRHPVFQVMFSLINSATDQSVKKSSAIQSIGVSRENSLFDLSLIAAESPEGLQLTLEYCSDLFEEGTALRMLEQLETLLEAISNTPEKPVGELSLLPRKEQDRILNEFNPHPIRETRGHTFLEMFDQQVKNYPESIACRFESEGINYKSVDNASSNLASELRNRGIVSGDMVVISMQRSVDMIIGILGILKVGGVYVPVDQKYPDERVQYILKDTQAKIFLTDQYREAVDEADQIIIGELNLSEKETVWGNLTGVTPEDTAYVIYTSGTTGNPKGVMITHASLASRLEEEMKLLSFSRNDAACLSTNFVFDVSVLEIFLTLYAGGTLVIPSEEQVQDFALLASLIGRERVTVLQGTPSQLAGLIEYFTDEQDLSQLRQICIGGESLNSTIIRQIKSVLPNAQINNHYGPTETTIDAVCLQNVETFKRNVIGFPLPGVYAYVMGGNMDLMPVGISGELYLGGVGVALGYLNQPELTREKFVDNPFVDGDRLYKTGDIVRWLADGSLEYLGRADTQVKIRGFRIELGEIEVALQDMHGISQCVIDVYEKVVGDPSLVAYIVPSQNYDESEILLQLKKQLPVYMLPAHFITLDHIPLTINGKVDRKALPKPELTDKNDYVPPQNKLQQLLVDVWAELLSIDSEKVSIDDNFFQLGGHSLLAVRLMARLKKVLYVQMPIAALFECPDIRSLALKIEMVMEGQSQEQASTLIPINKSGTKRPIYLVHGGGGSPMVFYPLASKLGKDQPVYAFQAQGFEGLDKALETVEEMAAQYLEELLKQPHDGSFIIGGYSFGGSIAYEMALRLVQMGYKVEHLILFDAMAPYVKQQNPFKSEDELLHGIAEVFGLMYGETISLKVEDLVGLDPHRKFDKIHSSVLDCGIEVSVNQLKGFITVYRANLFCEYYPEINAKPNFQITHFKAKQMTFWQKDNESEFDWKGFTTGKVVEHTLETSHWTLLNTAGAARIREELDITL
ncbi:amino acid adenylation domain-containing protein [Fulvivirga sp. 29W222]|uniref:Amino acid adenylation domain-containing protein n=1 Tax=Fulvivirga marina TaxID=2494733 RepID=A0A937G008_9BACT|nr:non-ribosomal peptide synthetase [Fulvivirga marina]MBL6449304.1 amino acid adenylation domain-containing protein [Fulvivirga marina]